MKFVEFISTLLSSQKRKIKSINWSDRKAKLSEHFVVGEATYLPSWGCYHMPSEEEKKSILEICQKLEKIRKILGKPIKVHVWIRPSKLNNPKNPQHGKDYNKAIGGAPRSAHRLGKAVDWHAKGISCDKVRKILASELEKLKIRMENNKGKNWIHIDTYPVKKNRFFKP